MCENQKKSKASAQHPGWTKPKGGAQYAGMGERTFYDWLKGDLRHIRLPSGTILIKYHWIDEFLQQYEVNQTQEDKIDQIVDEITSSVSD